MANDSLASIVALHQPKRSRAGTARTRTTKPRKRTKPKVAPVAEQEALDAASLAAETLIPPEFSQNDSTPVTAATPDAAHVAPSPTPAPHATAHVDAPARRRSVASLFLAAAAFALSAVGITTNGWFARSLGASDTAGWLFLAIGVAADLVALVMPSCAATLWQSSQRTTALAGWTVWAMTFVFAVTAGIGFASLNITDVTTARATRITPAVATAQSALSDAMAARDRECKGGVGKFCREREAAVVERRQILDAALVSVEQTADPQTDAAIKLVAWLSHGTLQPSDHDFAMLRLVLLALLPQIGGILLMVSRSAMRPQRPVA